ncbi:MAG: glutamate ligase domain-containing protein, partial [Nitriliruptoraceae bacterium]
GAGGGRTGGGRDGRVLGRGPAPAGQVVDVEVHGRRLEGLLLPVHGAHQAENLAVALGAVAALLGPSFDRVADEVLREAVARVRVPGRLEVVGAGPTVVLDGAHNPHAATALAAAVAELGHRDVVLLLSCLDDKDVEGVCAALGPVASHVVVAPAPSPRAAPVEPRAAAARAAVAHRGVLVELAGDVAEGFAMAAGVAGPRDAVLVTGSLTTVGAVRDLLLPPEGGPLAAGGVRSLAIRLDAEGEGGPRLG